MRLSIITAVVAVSSLALLSSTLVSAALTPQERVAYELSHGPDPNFCAPCLQKAMHNHFPHACAADIDSDAANARPEGATPEEERCICVAFQNLFWMKADCSAECPYVHNEKVLKYFLPSDKIEGCDNWINFAEGTEKEIEGFALKNPDHKPEIFEIAPPPPSEEGEGDAAAIDEEGEGRYKVTVSVTTKESEEKERQEKAKLELESGLKSEIKKTEDIKADSKEEDTKAEGKDEL